MSRYLIFTDLDGTLLDHHSYSFHAATEALNRIKSLHIPLIIVTSKTASEVIKLQQELDIQDPFVVENGGGIYIPEQYPLEIPKAARRYMGFHEVTLGAGLEEVQQFGDWVKKTYGATLFTDLPVVELSKLIGLSVQKAALSLQRRFSAPFFFKGSVSDDVNAAIESAASEKGLKILKGGRFYHIVGEKQDKGRAVQFMMALFDEAGPCAVKTIGLGDSNNDFDMLKVVDLPIAVKKHTGEHERFDVEGLIESSGVGPVGWNTELIRILSKDCK